MFSFSFYLKLFSNYNCLHIFIHKSKKRKYYKKTLFNQKNQKKTKKNQKVYHNQKKTVI